MNRLKVTLISALVIVIAATIYSCNKSGSEQSRQDYAADQIFSGLLFGEGPVASVVPQVSKSIVQPEEVFSNRDLISNVHETRLAVVNKIREMNPAFLQQFKIDMTSKDPEKIKQAYFDAAKLVYQSLFALNNIQTDRDKRTFYSQIQKAAKQYAVMNSDGSLNKESSIARLKTIALKTSSNRTIDPASGQCVTIAVAIAGTIVLLTVVAAVTVYAYSVTVSDAYVSTTSSERHAISGGIDNKSSFALDEMVGQISIAL